MKCRSLVLKLGLLALVATAPLAEADSPKEDTGRCYYNTISKAAYDKATATLRRNPNDLDALICAGRYQNDTLKQYANALKTLKHAEQVSIKHEERELNLIHRYLVVATGNLPAQGSYADDYNYYKTVRARADDANGRAFKQCWTALKNENFEAAINVASPSVWRNTMLSDGNHCLGRAYENKGEYTKALVHFHRLEWMADGIDNGLARAQTGLSRLYNSLEQYDRALAYGNKALAEWRRLGHKGDEATLLNNIAMIYENKGDKRRAITYFEQSLALEEKDENKAATWNNLALIYGGEGEYPKAIDYLEKALAAEQRAGKRLDAATTQLNLGDIHRQSKDYALSEQRLQAGLKTVQQLGAKNWEGMAYRSLGTLRFDQGKLDEAKQFTQKAIDISRETGVLDQTAVANLKFLNEQ